jgi:hypothetical protein
MTHSPLTFIGSQETFFSAKRIAIYDIMKSKKEGIAEPRFKSQ